MPLTADEILEHVKALPPRERLARVVHGLVEAESAEHHEGAMDRELERRIERAKSGHTVAAEDVMATLRARG